MTTPLRSLSMVAATGQPKPVTPVKIAVAGMNFFYGTTQALTDITIDLHANLVTAFIGPSGCGKSTFLRTLNRMNDIIPSAREGSYALGATKWQTIWHQVLPGAMPGIFTGLILAMSRAIGETAPLITIGALTYIPFAPTGLDSRLTVLPIQIYNWVSRPQAPFLENAAAGIIVLLLLLLTMNSVAVVLRDRFQKVRS